jgi:hypothetical protein
MFLFQMYLCFISFGLCFQLIFSYTTCSQASSDCSTCTSACIDRVGCNSCYWCPFSSSCSSFDDPGCSKECTLTSKSPTHHPTLAPSTSTIFSRAPNKIPTSKPSYPSIIDRTHYPTTTPPPLQSLYPTQEIIDYNYGSSSSDEANNTITISVVIILIVLIAFIYCMCSKNKSKSNSNGSDNDSALLEYAAEKGAGFVGEQIGCPQLIGCVCSGPCLTVSCGYSLCDLCTDLAKNNRDNERRHNNH